MCKQHVTCTHLDSRMARPGPSAAGDYVDYRMIRTPSTIPSRHSFALDLGTQRKAPRPEESPPVSSPSYEKVSISHEDLKLNISDPRCEILEQRGFS